MLVGVICPRHEPPWLKPTESHLLISIPLVSHLTHITKPETCVSHIWVNDEAVNNELLPLLPRFLPLCTLAPSQHFVPFWFLRRCFFCLVPQVILAKSEPPNQVYLRAVPVRPVRETCFHLISMDHYISVCSMQTIQRLNHIRRRCTLWKYNRSNLPSSSTCMHH